MIERGDHEVFDEPFSARYYFSPERRSDRFDGIEPGAGLEAVLADLLAAAETRPVFIKDMAYHVTDAISATFLGQFTNSYLAREPLAALSSLWRMWPDFTDDEAGYEALGRAFDVVPGPVIEADDLASDPAGIIEAWCEAIGLGFDPEALTWEPGMVPQWVHWRDWYKGVADSSGFQAPTDLPEGPPPPPDQRVRTAAAAARPVYDRLTGQRVTAT